MTMEELQALIEGSVNGALEERLAPLLAKQTDWSARVRAAERAATREERGIGVARLICAMAAGRGDPERAARWAEKQAWDDPELTKALAASVDSAGGFVIPPGYVAELIELLRPASVIRRMNPIELPMPVGTLDIPKQTGGAQAYYLAESTNIVPSQPAVGQVRLSWKTLAALVPVSNTLIRFSSPGADVIVRDDIVAAMATKQDAAFIRSDGTANEPKGLRYQVAPGNLIPANGTINLQNVTDDLSRLVLALEEANVRFLRPGWLLAPRTRQYLMTIRDGNGNFAFREEMLTGRLWGYPFASTTQIPSNLGAGSDESEIYLVDFADVVIGEAETLMIDVSQEAAYHDGANVVAAFSLDQTVVRALAQHDLALRHNESVGILTGVRWGAA